MRQIHESRNVLDLSIFDVFNSSNSFLISHDTKTRSIESYALRVLEIVFDPLSRYYSSATFCTHVRLPRREKLDREFANIIIVMFLLTLHTFMIVLNTFI